MPTTGLEDEFLLSLFHSGSILPLNQLKRFGYLSTRMTVHPSVPVNFLCPNLSVTSLPESRDVLVSPPPPPVSIGYPPFSLYLCFGLKHQQAVGGWEENGLEEAALTGTQRTEHPPFSASR